MLGTAAADFNDAAGDVVAHGDGCLRIAHSPGCFVSKTINADPQAPNAKNQLTAAARAVTEAINGLVDVCTASAPGQEECDNAVRATRAILLERPSGMSPMLRPVTGLVEAAAQRELINMGKISRRPQSNSDDGQWSEGLISAALTYSFFCSGGGGRLGLGGIVCPGESGNSLGGTALLVKRLWVYRKKTMKQVYQLTSCRLIPKIGGSFSTRLGTLHRPFADHQR